MTFANPMVLWLLLVIPPAVVVFFWWSWRKRQQLLTQFIAARLLPALTVGISTRRQKLRLACVLISVVALIVALARPQWGFEWEEARQRGLDVVIGIDTSKSMLAEDITPNRLARAKLAALDLMQQAKSDRLGLVAFAGGAFLQCPMTFDDAAFRQSVETLDVNIIPQGGTALAQAIETAVEAFKEGDNHKILVLFTDGEDQDPGAVEAARKAAEAGLRIFTIGIGTPEGELLRIKDAKGRTDYIRDPQGNVVKSRLNETLLQEIAGATPGGFYLPLRGAKTIDTLYEKGLAPLPKSDSQEKLIRQYHERYHWPLALAIALLMVEMVLPERKRAPKPKPAAPAKIAAAAAGLWLLLSLPSLALGSPSSALREYNAGKYDKAFNEYEQLLRKKNDPRLQFNAGAAAYRDRQFSEAVKRFNEALGSPDLKLQEQAYYNRGNSLYHLGGQIPDATKRTEAWESALKDFQNTLRLNPQDADAKFNFDFVKKKLEELKQQQQQQQQSKQDKSNQEKDQNQDQQQQNQEQNQEKNDQQENAQNQQDQSQQQQQKQQSQQEQNQDQQQANQSQEQKGQQEQQQEKGQEQDQEQAKQNQSQSGENQEQQEGEPARAYAGQMTPQQAQQLLDAQKGGEKLLPVRPVMKPADRSRPIKDW